MASSAYLVQLLLPVRDNDDRPFERDLHGRTRRELLDRFGGVTAYNRAPARGLWETPDGQIARDEVVIFEVMTADLDRAWWAGYREMLEKRFRQDEIVVRALACDRL